MNEPALEVSPAAMMSGEDRATLARILAGGEAAWRAVPPHRKGPRIELVLEPPFPVPQAELPPFGEAARVLVTADGARLVHHSFRALLRPAEGRAVLWRSTPEAYPLEIAARSLLCALLPRAGGLPLHAAGVVAAGRGLVFFGVSGAGKSTLAATASQGVLSDELVVVLPRPWRLAASGFWGEGEGVPVDGGAVPLAALCALEKGAEFELQQLTPAAAARRLLDTITVPAIAELWQQALAVLDELLADVPAFRMRWSKDEPPWEKLAATLSPERKR